MVGDYDEAVEFHQRATTILTVTRSHEVKGQTTAEIDATLDELEATVERMRRILAEEGAEIHSESDQFDSSGEESDGREKAAKAAEVLEEKAHAE